MEKQDFSAFDVRLREESGKLEQVAIRRKGNKLYVRGSFPAKPGQIGTSRADIPTGCNATPAGLKVAIAKAKAIDSDLQWGRFEWGPYLRGNQAAPATIGEWLERYESDHWQRTERTESKEASFQSGYRHYFSLLPSSSPLSIAMLRETIVTRSKPATRSRELCCMSYGALAGFAARHGGLTDTEVALFKQDLKRLKQGYKPKPKLPEQLPNDAQIVEIWQGIKNPAWRWVYGMLATYGLRPHEVFHLELDLFAESTDVLRVKKSTKTGARLTYPCLPQWRETFRLWEYRLPNIQTVGRSNEAIGKKISQEFRELKIPHIPYDLRHAWCIRLSLYGVDSSDAARWAGHSIQVHSETYQQAISEAQQQQVYERMRQRSKSSAGLEESP